MKNETETLEKAEEEAVTGENSASDNAQETKESKLEEVEEKRENASNSS